MRSLKTCVGALAVVCFLFLIVSRAEATVIGGWDLTRGGGYSLPESPYSPMPQIRSLATTYYPTMTFSGTSTLTPEFLATVDSLVIATGYSDSQPVTSLSPAEQSALMQFILDGHPALLLAERVGFSAAMNQTLINPFGLNIVGNIDSAATVVDPSAFEVTSSPHGTVTTLSPIHAGYFDQLGAAQVVATLDVNNQPVMAYLAPGALAPGSGAVILTADSDFYLTNTTLILNTFEFLDTYAAVHAPEPGSLCLAVGGALGAVLLFRRRRSRPVHS